MLRFRKFPVAKSLWIRGGGEVSRFSFESFLSDGAEKFRRRTLYCVIIFGCRKNSCFRGLCYDFSLNFFCLTVPEDSVAESFSLSII